MVLKKGNGTESSPSIFFSGTLETIKAYDMVPDEFDRGGIFSIFGFTATSLFCRQSGTVQTAQNPKISRSSLTFYFLHYLMIGWPPALIDLFTGKYRLYNLLDSIPAMICGLAALAVLGLGLIFWDARGGKYKLEGILTALVRRFASSPPVGKTS